MNISQDKLVTMWFENEKGERYIPDIGNAGFQTKVPDEFTTFHTIAPNILTEQVQLHISQAQVDNCEHLSIRSDYENNVQYCNQCGGRRYFDESTKKFTPWEGEIEAPLITMNYSWSEDLVLAMVHSGDYNLYQAIIIAGKSCERCMNVLAHKYNLDWGYPELSEEWKKVNCACVFCKDEYPIRVDSSEPKLIESQISKSEPTPIITFPIEKERYTVMIRDRSLYKEPNFIDPIALGEDEIHTYLQQLGVEELYLDDLKLHFKHYKDSRSVPDPNIG